MQYGLYLLITNYLPSPQARPFFSQDPGEFSEVVSDLLEDEGDNPLYTLIKEIVHTYNELDSKSQDVIKSSISRLIENLGKKGRLMPSFLFNMTFYNRIDLN
jgi:hypothetical protein